jgi:hypothetical protein
VFVSQKSKRVRELVFTGKTTWLSDRSTGAPPDIVAVVDVCCGEGEDHPLVVKVVSNHQEYSGTHRSNVLTRRKLHAMPRKDGKGKKESMLWLVIYDSLMRAGMRP